MRSLIGHVNFRRIEVHGMYSNIGVVIATGVAGHVLNAGKSALTMLERCQISLQILDSQEKLDFYVIEIKGVFYSGVNLACIIHAQCAPNFEHIGP